ncbi:MAG: hypothetical protein Q8P41_29190 [Pseudomonadota bacterium]|nr:hypothetical protein [Pseudomonadota bacterium]
MPRPFFPHTLHDVVHAVDGPLGLIVGDMPDGTLWVLKRNRKEPGYVLTEYADTQRSRVVTIRAFAERREAVNAMAAAIGLGESL